MSKPAIVKPPKNPEPETDKPLIETGNGNGLNDGMKFFSAIYRLIVENKPVAFYTISRYKKHLDLQKGNPWLFRLVLIPFLILDWIQAFLSMIAIVLILALLVFALAKLVGFTDWIDLHFFKLG